MYNCFAKGLRLNFDTNVIHDELQILIAAKSDINSFELKKILRDKFPDMCSYQGQVSDFLQESFAEDKLPGYEISEEQTFDGRRYRVYKFVESEEKVAEEAEAPVALTSASEVSPATNSETSIVSNAISARKTTLGKLQRVIPC